MKRFLLMIMVFAWVAPAWGFGIVSWGDDSFGQVSQTPAGDDFRAIAGGGLYSLALKMDGTLVSWGGDGYGEVSDTPTGTGFKAIAAGTYHGLALRTDGSIVSWGFDDSGQVSDTPAGTDFQAIAGGLSHGVALKIDGSIVSWGHDGNGLVSDTPAGTDFQEIAAGSHHSLALKTDGSIVSWGDDVNGSVSDTPAGTGFQAIAGGSTHSVALKADGSIVSWGNDYSGQVSDTPAGNNFYAVDAGGPHTLALAAVMRDVGWVKAKADVSLVGLLMYGNKASKGIAGLPASAAGATTHYVAHFASDENVWYTGIVVTNPSVVSPASVDLTAYDNNGSQVGSPAHVDVPAKGKISELVETLFGSNLGTGWIKVTSDIDVICFEVYGMWSGGIAALPSQELAENLALPHFVSDANWWTGVAVLNPASEAVAVTLKAYDGVAPDPIDQRNYDVPARGKIVGFVDTLLPSAANKTGWILVQAATGKQVAVTLVFGTKNSTPNEIAAAAAVPGSSTLIFSDFRKDANWWTGISLVNPRTIGVNVTMTAHRPDGLLIDSKIQAVPPQGKTWGFVENLFDLAGNAGGWIEAYCSVPIVGMEIIGGDDDAEQAWGVAAISPQAGGHTVYFGHYHTSSTWWSMVALVNLDGATAADVNIMAYGNDGVFGGVASETISPHGRLSKLVDELLWK